MAKTRILLALALSAIPCNAYAKTAQALSPQATVGRVAKGSRQMRERDPLGRVVRVWDPDGNLRQLTFDAEGNVVHARDKPHDVRFTCDRGRRVVGGMHSDGSGEGYAYRLDSELVEAKNDAGAVVLERDVLGRVMREVIGDDWVASEYDALGMRVRVRSSKGLDQRIQRNAVGQMVGVRATTRAAGSVTPDGGGDGRRGGRGGDGRDAGGGGAAAASGRGADGQGDVWEARLRRDVLGLEVERNLPGGVQSCWERDNVGRPVKQEVWSAGTFRRAVQYTWDVDDRLKMVIDATHGPTRYEHDRLGNLAAATYADGRVDLRMPDAVGNLFRSADRGDRKYGPAGQLLEARGDDGGITRYEYDAEGNLVRKFVTDAAGEPARAWTYAWNGAGMLAKVVRPDGDAVGFTYDALGRRLSKTFRGLTTRWIWDGNVPLHEWAERTGDGTEDLATAKPNDVVLDEVAARRRHAAHASRPAQGPPATASALSRSPELGTPEAPITWLFDPESFAPMAKLVSDARYAIVTDHLGTPTAMYDAAGAEVWTASIDTYGNLRDVQGDLRACPFRWPGQYEDAETGLHYNRFRYYEPDSGQYCSSDPFGLLGGANSFAYVSDSSSWIDPMGLSGCRREKTHVFYSGNNNAAVRAEAERWAMEHGATTLEMTGKGSFLEKFTKGLDWLEQGPAWRKASKLFAKEATGDVHVFLNKSGTSPTSVWNTIEKPLLSNNPAVRIIEHLI